jgi:transposase IS200 family protein
MVERAISRYYDGQLGQPTEGRWKRGKMETFVMAFACKEVLLTLLLCSILILSETNLSKSTELFELSELSRSQQSQLWTQVDNWAVAVVLANFCTRPTSLEERMLRIATRCIAASSIKEIVDRFHAKMNAVGILRKRYWGQHLWSRGYWVASSGNVTDEVWMEYIKSQAPPEPRLRLRKLSTCKMNRGETGTVSYKISFLPARISYLQL